MITTLKTFKGQETLNRKSLLTEKRASHQTEVPKREENSRTSGEGGGEAGRPAKNQETAARAPVMKRKIEVRVTTHDYYPEAEESKEQSRAETARQRK